MKQKNRVSCSHIWSLSMYFQSKCSFLPALRFNFTDNELFISLKTIKTQNHVVDLIKQFFYLFQWIHQLKSILGLNNSKINGGMFRVWTRFQWLLKRWSPYSSAGSSPESVIVTTTVGWLRPKVSRFPILRTISMLSSSKTFPNTTCLPSNHGVFARVMKNCEPFVLGPLLAILNKPAALWWV